MKSTPAQQTNSISAPIASADFQAEHVSRHWANWQPANWRSAVVRRANRRGAARSQMVERRAGSVLLVVVFVVAFTSLVLIGILKSVELQVAEQRATLRYERANYLAGAGVHHALMELQEDITWRGDIPETPFAPGSDEFYSATVVDAPEGGVVITAYGRSGEVTRRLEVLAE